AAAVTLLQATQALVDALDVHILRLGAHTRGKSARARETRAAVRQLLAERSRFALGPVGGGCVLPEVQLSPPDGREEARAKADLPTPLPARRRPRPPSAAASPARPSRQRRSSSASRRSTPPWAVRAMGRSRRKSATSPGSAPTSARRPSGSRRRTTSSAGAPA